MVARHGLALWLALLVVLATVFVLRERDQVVRIADILRDADSRWVAAAAGIEFGLIALTGLNHQALLGRLGHRMG